MPCFDHFCSVFRNAVLSSAFEVQGASHIFKMWFIRITSSCRITGTRLITSNVGLVKFK